MSYIANAGLGNVRNGKLYWGGKSTADIVGFIINRLKDEGMAGGTSYYFNDMTELTQYFIDNPTLLKPGISVGVGDPVEVYIYDGTSWVPGTLVFKGDKGDTGTAGNITVGSVYTLPAGSMAYVNNMGTATNAILNFGIPRGADGTNGQDGSGGGIVAETDPIYTADKPSLATIAYVDGVVNAAITALTAAMADEEDPVYLADKPTLATKTEVSNSKLNSLTFNAGTHTLTATMGDATTKSVVLPMASSSNDGIVTAGDMARFTTMIGQVDSLVQGGVWRAAYGTYAELVTAYPGLDVTATTWDENDFIDVSADETATTSTHTQGNASTYNVVKSGTSKFLVHRRDTFTPIQSASNTQLGVVKGSSADGGISIGLDGSMTMNGYTDIINKLPADGETIATLDDLEEAIAETAVTYIDNAATINIYVSPTGDNTNDGLTTATPVLNWTGVGIVLRRFNTNGRVIVNYMAGNHNGFTINENIGNINNLTSTASIVILGQGIGVTNITGTIYITSNNNNNINIEGMTLSNLILSYSLATINNVEFSGGTSNAINSSQSRLYINNNLSISGGNTYSTFLQVENGMIYFRGNAHNIEFKNNTQLSNAFMNTSIGEAKIVFVTYPTFTGTFIGKKFNFTNTTGIYGASEASLNATIPGTVNGTWSTSYLPSLRYTNLYKSQGTQAKTNYTLLDGSDIADNFVPSRITTGVTPLYTSPFAEYKAHGVSTVIALKLSEFTSTFAINMTIYNNTKTATEGANFNNIYISGTCGSITFTNLTSYNFSGDLLNYRVYGGVFNKEYYVIIELRNSNNSIPTTTRFAIHDVVYAGNITLNKLPDDFIQYYNSKNLEPVWDYTFEGTNYSLFETIQNLQLHRDSDLARWEDFYNVKKEFLDLRASIGNKEPNEAGSVDILTSATGSGYTVSNSLGGQLSIVYSALLLASGSISVNGVEVWSSGGLGLGTTVTPYIDVANGDKITATKSGLTGGITALTFIPYVAS
jgi:hypothetical protein